jgi:pyruvate kinase
MKIIRDLNDEYGYTTAILGDLQVQNSAGVMNEGVVVNDGDLIRLQLQKIFLEQLKSVHEI